MSEFTWHSRPLHPQHRKELENLQDEYALTRLLKAVPWTPPSSLEELDDDTSPTEVLLRWKNRCSQAQAAGAAHFLVQHTSRQELLDQAESSGKAAAKGRWNTSLPPESCKDLRMLLWVIAGTPLSHGLGTEGFLVKRNLKHEITLGLRHCPHHRLENPLDSKTADLLCEVWTYWLKGYVKFLNPDAKFSNYQDPQFCWVQWT